MEILNNGYVSVEKIHGGAFGGIVIFPLEKVIRIEPDNNGFVHLTLPDNELISTSVPLDEFLEKTGIKNKNEENTDNGNEITPTGGNILGKL